MEVAMTNYSELVVLFFLIPVILQIIIPLVMLAGFSMVSVVNAVFRRLKFGIHIKSGVKVREELQLSKP